MYLHYFNINKVFLSIINIKENELTPTYVTALVDLPALCPCSLKGCFCHFLVKVSVGGVGRLKVG